jgi:hypothetical protein
MGRENLLIIFFIPTLICFTIALPLLIAGYQPRILTESQYNFVVSAVIGYGRENIECVYSCNCRYQCRLTKPNCKNSWEKQYVCDVCTTLCTNQWVVYSVLPPGTPYIFNAFNSISLYSRLESQYPLNSTMDGYYSSTTDSSGNIIQRMVYGNEMTKAINCFIAGFVFFGIGCVTLLLFALLLILYCLGK